MLALWIDDVRDPFEHGFDEYLSSTCDAEIDGIMWANTGEQAIQYLNDNKFAAISFDHDLGFGIDGYDVACELEKMVYANPERFKSLKFLRRHSRNPVGMGRLASVFTSIQKVLPMVTLAYG